MSGTNSLWRCAPLDICIPKGDGDGVHYNSGRSHYYRWTKAHCAEIPAIARLANDDEWEQVNQNVAYSAGASFLACLPETRGAAQLRMLYYARASDFAAQFAAIHGRSLTEVEAEWLAFCEAFAR